MKVITNPFLAPRGMKCRVCPDERLREDLDIRLWDEDGPKPRGPARAYLMERMGWNATQAGQAIGNHVSHVERYLAEPYDPAPMNKVKRIGPAESVHWLDVNQNAMNLGNEAIRDLNVMRESGDLAPKELVAVAKLGVVAAQTRMSAEYKGKALPGLERLMELAAGLE